MRVPIALLILLFGTVAYAGGIETVIAPPAEMPQAGHSTVFSVYFHNPEDNSLPVDIPNSIVCRLSAGNETVEVKACTPRGNIRKDDDHMSGVF